MQLDAKLFTAVPGALLTGAKMSMQGPVLDHL